MTRENIAIQDKPNSRLQKYRLTDKGRRWLTLPMAEYGFAKE